jgi:hypothetical protein
MEALFLSYLARGQGAQLGEDEAILLTVGSATHVLIKAPVVVAE